ALAVLEAERVAVLHVAHIAERLQRRFVELPALLRIAAPQADVLDHLAASCRRAVTRAAHSGSISLHATRRASRSAAAGIEPLPAKGSSTTSPGRDQSRNSGSSTVNGLWLGCAPQRCASPSSS